VLCLHNVSSQSQKVTLNMEDISVSPLDEFTDLIKNEQISVPLNGKLALKPYQTLWLRITK